MSFLDNQKKIAALYVAAYNRAPDQEGLEYWTNFLQDADDEYAAYVSVAERFVAVDLFDEIYNTSEGNRLFVESVYQNMFGEAGDEEGIAYWTEALDNGASKGAFLVRFLDAARGYEADPENPLNEQALAHQAILENKIDVGLYYVETLGEATNVTTPGDVNDPAYQNSINIIAGVTADEATVAAAKADINNQSAELIGETFFLTEGPDRDTDAPEGFIKGTAGNDKFIADVVQVNGLQVNTLGSGDRLDGGAGNDTLQAEITAGAYAGGSGGNMAIKPTTKNIENIVLNAVENTLSGDAASEVYLNAQNMTDINYIGSEYSNASLTVQDLTTKGVGDTDKMTVGMKYTGNSNSAWDESNLTVLFDQDYLTRELDTSSSAYFWLEDRQGAKDNPAKPLNRINVDGVRFTLDGEAKSLIIDSAKMDEFLNGAANAGTWEGFVALLQEALTAAQADDPSLAGLSWSLDYTKLQTVGLDGTSLPVPAPAMVLTSDVTGQVVEAVGYHQYEEATGQYDVYGSFNDGDQIVTYNPVTINVELEKVGRAGDGGELVIGSMNKGLDSNTWNPDDVNTVGEGTVSGIEVFNVTVDGGKAESSSLAGLRSTSNNLRTVNVVSAEDSDANLKIGNLNTERELLTGVDGVGPSTLATYANALKDVKVFDASEFKGDLDLRAALTGEVTPKYLADGGNNDGDFVYTGGDGNDTFNIALAADNLAASGTNTHGDFNFALNSGAGNDTITVGIYDGVDSDLADASATTPWYQNQSTNSANNANLSINAGDGNDIVNLLGSGDWDVNLGAGNDVIYVDNAGDTGAAADPSKSSWIFNLAATSSESYVQLPDNSFAWENAVGGGNPTYNLYKTGVTLTLKDDKGGNFELYFAVDPDAGVNNLTQTTQKAINNAIKDAIANDTVFSKLLQAKTGQMADTLIIDSLIDGATEITFAFEQLVNTDGQTAVNAFNAKYGADVTVGGLSATTVTTNAIPVVLTDAFDESVNASTEAGDAGITFGNQIIEGGKGDDVLVLGTSDDQAHSLVYNGYENGIDTIVNFVTGGSGSRDVIDLSSYDADGFLPAVSYANAAAIKTAVNGLGATAGEQFIIFDADANVGEYEVSVWEVGATAADTFEVGVIGVMDFGQNVIFDATVGTGNLVL